jgi:hypothetical protein
MSFSLERVTICIFQKFYIPLSIKFQKHLKHRASAADIDLYLTTLEQARQFIDACGTYNPYIEGNLFTFLGQFLVFCPRGPKNKL